jgi:hypothetical protein
MTITAEGISHQAGHYGAVKEYSEGTIAGSKRQQDAALAHLASNADETAVFP